MGHPRKAKCKFASKSTEVVMCPATSSAPSPFAHRKVLPWGRPARCSPVALCPVPRPSCRHALPRRKQGEFLAQRFSFLLLQLFSRSLVTCYLARDSLSERVSTPQENLNNSSVTKINLQRAFPEFTPGKVAAAPGVFFFFFFLFFGFFFLIFFFLF